MEATMKHIQIILLIQLFPLTQQHFTAPTCPVILNNIIESCQYSGVTLEYDRLPYRLMLSNDAQRQCSSTHVCREDFKITRLHTQTFADIFDKIISNMVARCCGECANLTVVRKINNFSEILNQSSDFVYPVLGKTLQTELYGYEYLPVLEVQDAYYFSLRFSSTDLARKVIKACFEMWPLLVICLIMAILSGFVIWAMEMRVNANEFPPFFCKGIYQGYYKVQDAYYFSLRFSSTDLARKVIKACFEMWPLLVICLIMAILSGFVIWALEMRVNANEFPPFFVQDAYYFSLRFSSTDLARKVIKACFEMWPLLVICLIMAILSGFVIWALEMRVNANEFPPSFCKGIYQGFWWSFISMTTVGYGDTYPRSLIGRLFAVMWIITGITLCSIFTASMTAHITKARDITADSDIMQKKVGVLKGRLEDELMVINHGGVPYELEYSRTVSGIIDLVEKLQQKQIDGFLLNKDTFQFLSRRIKRKEYESLLKRLEENIHKSLKKFSKEQFSFGLLVKNQTDHVFFQKYFRNNRVLIDSCHVMEATNKTVELELSGSFANDEEIFHSFLYYTLIMLGVMVLFGICYEVKGYVRKRSIEACA